MHGDLSGQVGSEGDFLVSVFFFHATRGIIKQPIVFMANLENIKQTAADAAIHGKAFCPNKTKNDPCSHSSTPSTAARQGNAAFGAQ